MLLLLAWFHSFKFSNPLLKMLMILMILILMGLAAAAAGGGAAPLRERERWMVQEGEDMEINSLKMHLAEKSQFTSGMHVHALSLIHI